MNEQARSLVQELGGKHGLLEYLRGKPQVADQIVPAITLAHNDPYTAETEQKLRSLCSRYGCKSVIIRTSEQSDWNGMVDTMPTKKNQDIDSVPYCIEKMMEECRSPALLQYAQWEGNGYNPEKVSFSFGPDFGGPYFTLTEHPNQKDVHLFDAVDFYQEAGKLTDALNIDENGRITDQAGDEKRFTYASITDTTVSSVVDISRNAKEELNLDEKEVFQHELVERRSYQFLSQVRRFARANIANFIIEMHESERKRHSSPRIFGVTDAEGIDLPLAKGHFRQDAQIEGESLNQAYALHPSCIRNALSLSDFPQNMQAYVPKSSLGGVALAHNNTRFGQVGRKCQARFGNSRRKLSI